LELACQHHHRRAKYRITIINRSTPDTYGLLLLAPELPLAKGWLGGDRVVGRAAVSQLLLKVHRFSCDEQQRLSIYLPSKEVALGWNEIEGMLAIGTATPKNSS